MAATSSSMKRGVGFWVALVVGVVLAGFVWLLATGDSAGSRVADSPLLGKPAPALVGDTLDGSSFDLEDRRGRWVVVNFFATWCVPCVREHPELVRFSNRHLEAGDAEVVSVQYDRNDETDLREFFERNGGDWPVVGDPDGRISLDYGVTGIPESFLVDPSGFVVSKIVGGVSADQLDELLAAAEAQRDQTQRDRTEGDAP